MSRTTPGGSEGSSRPGSLQRITLNKWPTPLALQQYCFGALSPKRDLLALATREGAVHIVNLLQAGSVHTILPASPSAQQDDGTSLPDDSTPQGAAPSLVWACHGDGYGALGPSSPFEQLLVAAVEPRLDPLLEPGTTIAVVGFSGRDADVDSSPAIEEVDAQLEDAAPAICLDNAGASPPPPPPAAAAASASARAPVSAPSPSSSPRARAPSSSPSASPSSSSSFVQMMLQFRGPHKLSTDAGQVLYRFGPHSAALGQLQQQQLHGAAGAEAGAGAAGVPQQQQQQRGEPGGVLSLHSSPGHDMLALLLRPGGGGPASAGHTSRGCGGLRQQGVPEGSCYANVVQVHPWGLVWCSSIRLSAWGGAAAVAGGDVAAWTDLQVAHGCLFALHTAGFVHLWRAKTGQRWRCMDLRIAAPRASPQPPGGMLPGQQQQQKQQQQQQENEEQQEKEEDHPQQQGRAWGGGRYSALCVSAAGDVVTAVTAAGCISVARMEPLPGGRPFGRQAEKAGGAKDTEREEEVVGTSAYSSRGSGNKMGQGDGEGEGDRERSSQEQSFSAQLTAARSYRKRTVLRRVVVPPEPCGAALLVAHHSPPGTVWGAKRGSLMTVHAAKPGGQGSTRLVLSWHDLAIERDTDYVQEGRAAQTGGMPILAGGRVHVLLPASLDAYMYIPHNPSGADSWNATTPSNSESSIRGLQLDALSLAGSEVGSDAWAAQMALSPRAREQEDQRLCQVALLEHAQVSDGPAQAMQLCSLNGWSRRALLLRALQSALALSHSAAHVQRSLEAVAEEGVRAAQQVLGAVVHAAMPHVVLRLRSDANYAFASQLLKLAGQCATQALRRHIMALSEDGGDRRHRGGRRTPVSSNRAKKRHVTGPPAGVADIAHYLETVRVLQAKLAVPPPPPVAAHHHSSSAATSSAAAEKDDSGSGQVAAAGSLVAVPRALHLEPSLSGLGLPGVFAQGADGLPSLTAGAQLAWGTLPASQRAATGEGRRRMADSRDSRDVAAPHGSRQVTLAGRRERRQESAGEMLARWQRDKLPPAAVVKDALRAARVALAVVHLQRTLGLAGGKGGRGGDAFTLLRVIGRGVAYDLLCKGRRAAAVQALEQLGEDVGATLREIALGALRRDLRAAAAHQLHVRRQLAPADAGLLHTASLLEHIYPSSSFWATYMRLRGGGGGRAHAELPGGASWELRLGPGGPACGEVDGIVGASWGGPQRAPQAEVEADAAGGEGAGGGEGVGAGEDEAGGPYMCVSAAWLRRWDSSTLLRVCLEQGQEPGEGATWSAHMEYCSAHQLWRPMAHFLAHLPSAAAQAAVLRVDMGPPADEALPALQSPPPRAAHGDLDEVWATSPTSLGGAGQGQVELPGAAVLAAPWASLCGPMLRERAQVVLAGRLIFLSATWRSAKELLALLAQAGVLFGGPDSAPRGKQAHSFREALHGLVVQHCSDSCLPNLLQVYLDLHGLATTSAEAALLQAYAGDSEWVHWLLMTRLPSGGHYLASLANATWLLQGEGSLVRLEGGRGGAGGGRHPTPSRSPSQPLSLQDVLTPPPGGAQLQQPELVALVTLVHAPQPLQRCLVQRHVAEGEMHRWQCYVEDLQEALRWRYPSLWATLRRAAGLHLRSPPLPFYPSTGAAVEESLDSLPAGNSGETKLEQYQRWRAALFTTASGDASLLTLAAHLPPGALRSLVGLATQGTQTQASSRWQQLSATGGRTSKSSEKLRRTSQARAAAVEEEETAVAAWEAAIWQTIAHELHAHPPQEAAAAEVEHYLARARPLAAFRAFLRHRPLRPQEQRHGEEGPLWGGERHALHAQVLAVGITHYAAPQVVGACALLLELCGLSSSQLRADVAALLCISQHATQQSQVVAPGGNARAVAEPAPGLGRGVDHLARALAGEYERVAHAAPPGGDVAGGWLEAAAGGDSVATAVRPEVALAILRQLEASLVAEIGASNGASSDGAGGGGAGAWLGGKGGDGGRLRAQQHAASLRWTLVTSFCRAHAMPPSDVYLRLLARDSDWVGFLAEAQAEAVPLPAVIALAEEEFGSSRVRSHLLIVLHNLRHLQQQQPRASRNHQLLPAPGTATEGQQEKVSERDGATWQQRAELFGLLAECEGRERPGQALLEAAQRHCWPMLAMLASCFPDVSPLECLARWLEITAARVTLSVSASSAAQAAAASAARAVAALNRLHPPAAAHHPSQSQRQPIVEEERSRPTKLQQQRQPEPGPEAEAEPEPEPEAETAAEPEPKLEPEPEPEPEPEAGMREGAKDAGLPPAAKRRRLSMELPSADSHGCHQHLQQPQGSLAGPARGEALGRRGDAPLGGLTDDGNEGGGGGWGVAGCEASVAALVSVLSQQQCFAPLLRAFELFAPDSSLLHFLRFLQAFACMRLDEAEAHLSAFGLRLHEEGAPAWIRAAAQSAAQAQLSASRTAYEEAALLALLASADFADGGAAAARFKRQALALQLAASAAATTREQQQQQQQHPPPPPAELPAEALLPSAVAHGPSGLREEEPAAAAAAAAPLPPAQAAAAAAVVPAAAAAAEGGAAYLQSARPDEEQEEEGWGSHLTPRGGDGGGKDLLESLMTAQLWDEARVWAQQLDGEEQQPPDASGLMGSAQAIVTLRQASAMVDDWRGLLWDEPSERAAVIGHCHTLFLSHPVPPSQAAAFFLQQAEEGGGCDTAEEQHRLHLLALQWLCNAFAPSSSPPAQHQEERGGQEDAKEALSLAPERVSSRQLAGADLVRTRQAADELEANVWLLAAKVDAERHQVAPSHESLSPPPESAVEHTAHALAALQRPATLTRSGAPTAVHEGRASLTKMVGGLLATPVGGEVASGRQERRLSSAEVPRLRRKGRSGGGQLLLLLRQGIHKSLQPQQQQEDEEEAEEVEVEVEEGHEDRGGLPRGKPPLAPLPPPLSARVKAAGDALPLASVAAMGGAPPEHQAGSLAAPGGSRETGGIGKQEGLAEEAEEVEWDDLLAAEGDGEAARGDADSDEETGKGRRGEDEQEAALLLLDEGQVEAAERLFAHLEMPCPPEALLLTCARAIATNGSLPPGAQERLQQLGVMVPPVPSRVPSLPLVEALVAQCREGHGRTEGRRIAARLRAAHAVGLAFTQVRHMAAEELLQLLALRGQEALPAAHMLLAACHVAPAAVARILAAAFLKGVLAAYNGGYMAGPQTDEGPSPLLWRASDVATWAGLCSRQAELGHAILRLILPRHDLAPACEVELLILAQQFYERGGCLDGLDVLEGLAAEHASRYIARRHMAPAVRLLHGLNDSRTLHFVYDRLISAGHLAKLLEVDRDAAQRSRAASAAERGGVGAEAGARGGGHQLELRLAVLSAAQRIVPWDQDSFDLVYRHYEMRHEMARAREGRAEEDVRRWLARRRPQVEEEESSSAFLLAAMHTLCRAAQSWADVDCGRSCAQAVAQGALLALQVRMPDSLWLRLSNTAARRLMMEQQRFEDALVVAQAYGLSQQSDWTPVLWVQMLHPRRLREYLDDFTVVLPLPGVVLMELAGYYRAEVGARGENSRYLAAAFRQLLRRTQELALRLQAATVAGDFPDILDDCLRRLDRVPSVAGPLLLRKGHGGTYMPLL